MRAIFPLRDVRPEDLPLVGGKAVSLARLMQNGFAVPEGLCVATTVYRAYVADAGLRERILMELNRKDERHLRWEEVWDSALRIRNMFLNRPLPARRRAAGRHAHPRRHHRAGVRASLRHRRAGCDIHDRNRGSGHRGWVSGDRDPGIASAVQSICASPSPKSRRPNPMRKWFPGWS